MKNRCQKKPSLCNDPKDFKVKTIRRQIYFVFLSFYMEVRGGDKYIKVSEKSPNAGNRKNGQNYSTWKL